MTKRVVLIAAVLVLTMVLALAVLSQAQVPDEAPARFPLDGETATLVTENALANINSGRGIMELALPYRVDGHPVQVMLPAIIEPGTWVRTGSGLYVPARLLPTRDSQVVALAQYLTDGDEDALRCIVTRRGGRLYVETLEPATSQELKASSVEVDSLGVVNFLKSDRLTGLVNGVSGDSEVATVDFNTKSAVLGFPAWVRIEARVPESAALRLDGKSLDVELLSEQLGMSYFDVVSKAVENEVTLTFDASHRQLVVTAIDGTKNEYHGAYPGDTGRLEEELW